MFVSFFLTTVRTFETSLCSLNYPNIQNVLKCGERGPTYFIKTHLAKRESWEMSNFRDQIHENRFWAEVFAFGNTNLNLKRQKNPFWSKTESKTRADCFFLLSLLLVAVVVSCQYRFVGGLTAGLNSYIFLQDSKLFQPEKIDFAELYLAVIHCWDSWRSNGSHSLKNHTHCEFILFPLEGKLCLYLSQEGFCC